MTAALPAPPMLPAPPSDSEIHDHLVAALLDQRLLPGTKLVEDKLGQVYGVSRTRIRQVLIRLAQSQLVTLQPHRGAWVARPSVAASREVFEVRQLIEPTLLQRAIQRASADDLQALAEQIAQEEQARRDGQQALALRLSGEFHLLLARLADHGTLERLLRELVSRTALVLMSYGSQRPTPPTAAARWVDACNCRDHRGLLAAIRRHAVAEAQALMRQHLRALEASLCFNPPEAPETDLVALLRGPAAG